MSEIKPWIASEEVPFDYFGKHYQCPDCKRCVVVDPDDIDEYNFCPVCGARRVEDAPED